MAIVDDLELEKTKQKFRTCIVCRQISKMDPEDAQAIRDAFSSGRPNAVIYRVMSNNGYPVGETSVGRHRSQGH